MIKQIATDISKEAIMFCKNTYLNYTNHFEILEYGITEAMPSFNSLMHTVVKLQNNSK